VDKEKLVKFEEVTPTLLRVAYFDGHLTALISHLNLPIYGGYDGLDEMMFAFLTLPSGKTVTLGEYANSPRVGVDLYVDSKMEDISVVVYESCQQIGTPRERVVWFRDKFQAEVEQLFEGQGDIKEIERKSEKEKQQVIYNPIACFQHSLQIYDRSQFPEYWAMLQYNLGSAYYKVFQKGKGDRGRYLKLSIDHYLQSEKVYTQDKYPERWKISQDTVRAVKRLSAEDLTGAKLVGANLSKAFLGRAKLMGADLREADLSRSYLIEANFNGANLSGVNLSGANVTRTIFGSAVGLSSELRENLKHRGAIFDDQPSEDSRSTISY
jgi:Pentapeptide repeats (8 copies)